MVVVVLGCPVDIWSYRILGVEVLEVVLWEVCGFEESSV